VRARHAHEPRQAIRIVEERAAGSGIDHDAAVEDERIDCEFESDARVLFDQNERSQSRN